MTSLIILSEIRGSIFVNGGFFSLCQNGSITLPLGSESTVINYFPFDGDFCPLCFEFSKTPKIYGGESELTKLSEELFLLKICPGKYYVPRTPILEHQTMWGKGFAGLCGGFFCAEFDGKSTSYNEMAEKFEILSENFALIKNENKLIIVDRNCLPKIKIDNVIEYSVTKNIFSVKFSPGNMDYFTVSQQYETVQMRIIKNEITKSEAETEKDKIFCFCQAVRLNMEEVASQFITKELKEEMQFSAIREFLGNFHEAEDIKYGDKRENSLALKYKIDKWNCVCRVFFFKFKNGLIDDIEQL